MSFGVYVVDESGNVLYYTLHYSLHFKLIPDIACTKRDLRGSFSKLISDIACNSIMEDILSPDEGSCASSHASIKSEKNMADFEGEVSEVEEELAAAELAEFQEAAAGYDACHMQHLANVASLYQRPHRQQGCEFIVDYRL